jgi:hypothetical protein
MRKIRLVSAMAAIGTTGAVLAMAVAPSSAAEAATSARGNTSAAAAASRACSKRVAMRPAAHFNPQTASVAQLNAHDFPPPPPTADKAAYATWERYVSMYLSGRAWESEPCTPDEALQPSPGTPDSAANFWSGYVAHNASYTDVESSWVVPVANGKGTSSNWVGIGLGDAQGYPLVQAGEYTPANGDSYAFMEIATALSGIIPSPIYKVPGLTNIGGHLLFVHVTFDYNGARSIHFVDEATGGNYHPTPPPLPLGGGKPDGHAEVVTEDPGMEAQPLADFRQVSFMFSQAASLQHGWQYFGETSEYSLEMTDKAGHVMARPDAVDLSGDFSNFWERAT